MSDFYRAFPKLADSELRSFTVAPAYGSSLPAGQYTLLELYCNEKGCDCRRVTIAVFAERNRDFVAHINLGFDSDGVMAGPFLDPMNPQARYAGELLDLFTDIINEDPAYLARLQRHYVLFKERLEGRRYAGPPFEKPGVVERIAAADPPMPSFDRGSDIAFPAGPVRREAKVGRNDPCPCGSGKKYKRCCLGKPAPAQAELTTSAPGSDHLSETDAAKPQGGPTPDDQALANTAEELIADVVRWRRHAGHQERWSADVQRTLEVTHSLAFAFLRLLLMRYAPDGRRQTPSAAYDACLDLLDEALTQIRYSLERKRPLAIAMAEQVQTEMAEQAFRPEVDVRVQQDLIMALHSAKLELHTRIREKAAEVADYHARFSTAKGAPDLDSLLERLARETQPRDAFDLLDPVLAEMELMPVEGQIVLAAGMMASSQAVFNELAVLMLLHPNRQVRIRLSDLYREPGCVSNLSPLGLRRLIGLRNWLPVAERPAVDALIKEVRLTGIASAPLPQAKQVGVYASPFDGSGTQAAWLGVKERRRYRIEGVLVRQGEGIREAWNRGDMTKPELDAMRKRLADDGGTMRVDSGYLRRLIAHFIAVGLDQDAPPPPRLISANEWAGGGYWKPEFVSPVEEIERMVATDPGAFSPEHVQRVLAEAGAWPRELSFATAWFEDDAQIDELLRERVGGPERWLQRLPVAVTAIVDQLLEQKRAVWAERLLWMALWSGACQTRPSVPWQDFLIVAMVLQRGAPLAEIPLMRAVAERSVHSAWQRKRV